MLEHRSAAFAALTTAAISVGGIIEITPMFAIPIDTTGISHYTPLQVAGRDIYVREGCYNCHSQMIRPFRSETLRYGTWSRAAEYAWDRPFQLGSRRIGPDLMRVGGKYPDAWHYEHMRDPRSTSPGSIMPRYSWLLTQKLDTSSLPSRLGALRKIGVPYPAGYENGDAQKDLVNCETNREIVALIAYLQRLGKDIKSAPAAPAPAAAAATK
jgi:cytochrome c oxidase cbb3-type subunit I/II